MGEIDTKSIKSVQTALTLFEEKCQQRKKWLSSSDLQQELEGLLKDLATCKLQLEAKDSTYLQALLKLEHYQKTTDKLATELGNSEAERDEYMAQLGEATTHSRVLESKINDMTDQLTEAVKIRDQLSDELKAAQGEVHDMGTELAATRMTHAEMMETAASMERDKVEELTRHISELKEALLMEKMARVEAEKEKCVALAEKDGEIELLRDKANRAQDELEEMRREVDRMQELDSEVLVMSILIETLQQELKQAKEQLHLSKEDVFEAMNRWKELEADIEVKEDKSLDQEAHIEALEKERDELKAELGSANEEVNRLTCDNELLEHELSEAQVETALVKSELHKERSKTASAEARAESVKSGLYLAVQELAIEAEQVKKENQRLRQEANGKAEETLQDIEFDDHSNPQYDDHVTISMEEYESLIKKANQQVTLPEVEDSCDKEEVEVLKKELEVAMVKVGELRSRAEQAVSRAERAERAKAAVEDQLRKWREQKQRKKAALEELRKESVPKKYDDAPSSSSYNPTPPTTYQPLSKILNMKF